MARIGALGAGLVLGLCLLVGRASHSSARDGLARFPPDAARSAASRYAALDQAACFAQLRKLGIAFTPVKEARGVLAPVRLTAPVGGVRYRTDFPLAQRRQVPWEVIDCRLVLALRDLSSILQAHDVDEVRYFSAWRPPAKRWPAGKTARRHPGALAIDIRLFMKRDGTELSVEDHFNGKIGSETCGPGAAPPRPQTPEAREIRSIVCEAADARIFHSILTPNYDRPHHNHFHLEVTAKVKWFIVR